MRKPINKAWSQIFKMTQLLNAIMYLGQFRLQIVNLSLKFSDCFFVIFLHLQHLALDQVLLVEQLRPQRRHLTLGNNFHFQNYTQPSIQLGPELQTSQAVLPESLSKKQPNFIKPQKTYIKALLKTQNIYIKALSKGKNIYIKAQRDRAKTSFKLV